MENKKRQKGSIVHGAIDNEGRRFKWKIGPIMEDNEERKKGPMENGPEQEINVGPTIDQKKKRRKEQEFDKTRLNEKKKRWNNVK